MNKKGPAGRKERPPVDEEVSASAARFLAAFAGISNVFASVGAFRELSLSKLEVLTIEAVHINEGLSMSELARRLDIRLSSATILIDRLVEKGFIERVRNGGDRRLVRLKLTQKGKRAAGNYAREMKNIFADLLSVLSKEERDALISIFEKIVSRVQPK